MLVSTHNLGSVPEFCDRAILLNRTRSSPTARRRTSSRQANLERAFGGVLRHFVLKPAEGGEPRVVGVLTDDERPFVVFGDERWPPPPARSRDRTSLMTRPPRAVRLRLHGERDVGERPRRRVCAFLSAYLMLKGWSLIGDALSHSIVPGRRRRLHARPAVLARRVPLRRPRRRRDALPQPAHASSRRTRSSG